MHIRKKADDKLQKAQMKKKKGKKSEPHNASFESPAVVQPHPLQSSISGFNSSSEAVNNSSLTDYSFSSNENTRLMKETSPLSNYINTPTQSSKYLEMCTPNKYDK